jgi:hypothetical protein
MKTAPSRPPIRGAPSDSWRSLRAAHGLSRRQNRTIALDVILKH